MLLAHNNNAISFQKQRYYISISLLFTSNGFDIHQRYLSFLLKKTKKQYYNKIFTTFVIVIF
jgi:hypothetical protein